MIAEILYDESIPTSDLCEVLDAMSDTIEICRYMPGNDNHKFLIIVRMKEEDYKNFIFEFNTTWKQLKGSSMDSRKLFIRIYRMIAAAMVGNMGE